MAAPGQPGLFDDPDPSPAASAARARFLAGMLAVWVLDGKKPTGYQRAELERLAHQTLTVAEGVRLAS